MVFDEKAYQHQYYLEHKERWKGKYKASSDELEEHHVMYKEIHGIDKTVFLTPSEHKKLHLTLSKRIGYIKPSKEIIVKAKNRASKNRDYRLKYRHSDAGKQKQIEYRHKYQHRFLFTYGFEGSLRLMESVTYNTSTDTITFTSAFYSTKVSLKRIEENEPVSTSIPSYI